MMDAFIKQGDCIGVCAPSARFDGAKLNKGIHILENLGFTVKVPDRIFNEKRYLAGNDIDRADVLVTLFADQDVDAVICARGGFGSMRILQYLNWDMIRHNNKPFIGFSDVTALLLSMISETGNTVIHGPNVVSLVDAEKNTLDSFYSAIVGLCDKIEFTNVTVIKQGSCKGVLKGGNITTISHLLGTRFQPWFNNCILFIEDIGEAAYKIDRMLTQMKMSGIFEGIQGVVAGSFENCSNDYYIEEILLEVFDGYGVPIVSGLDSGHGKINLSLPMGSRVELDTSALTMRWI